MTNNSRISHARGFTLKFKQALKAVEQCACVWVIYGHSIRDASLAESIAMRNKQASEREPLPNMEIPGLVYQPATRNLESSRKSYPLIRQAREFAAAQ